ncbi:fatty-acid--CoA ligase [Pseudomonas sp. AU11447]|uniref:acyl-CoA synthetase n=1 Tax=unclassified Pseudomonas TaxID=196821 RepID=UPI0006D42F67|nr:long-chain fatty acid--CoA ligase [Pseudomonas sp. AU11447]OBY88482.1 fatty-acid--CoA ligase [Pseudomonas sp. AU11447]
MHMTHALQRALLLHPDRLVTIFRDRRRNYREFGERVARLAGALQALGMQPGDRVGMLGLNSDWYFEYVLGTWWGGGVINGVNTRWSVPEIVYSLDDCDTRILLVDDNFLAMAEDIRRSAKVAPVLIHVGDGPAPDGMLSYEQLLREARPVEDCQRGGTDLASIMYTGGTTGHPKGVMHSHQNIWSMLMARLAGHPIEEGAVVLHVAPMFHAAALAAVLLQYMMDLPHVFMPGFEPVELMQTIQREQVRETLLVPVMLQVILTHPEFHRYDLSSLKSMVYGAAPISPALMNLALEHLPGLEFTQGYGMTETTSGVVFNGPENHSAAGVASGRIRAAGQPGISVLARIVDEQGEEVPRGSVGEILLRGPQIMLGYWNRPEETAQALRGGWMHTGDAGYMDDEGYIYIVDRVKDMIVSGGENVYSAEVEGAIASHPAVALSAVIGIPHAKWGEAVHAVIVLKPGTRAEGEEIIEHCRRFIAGYKCPKTVEFREAMPLSAAGKILKRDLRSPYWKDQQRAVN